MKIETAETIEPNDGPAATEAAVLRGILESPDELYDAYFLAFSGVSYDVGDYANGSIIASIPPSDMPKVAASLKGDLSNVGEVIAPYRFAVEVSRKAIEHYLAAERSNAPRALQAAEIGLKMLEEAKAKGTVTDVAFEERLLSTRLHVKVLRLKIELFAAEDELEAADKALERALKLDSSRLLNLLLDAS